MNTSAKGRRAEHKARRILEAAGYDVVRAAASKGPADLVAWNWHSIKFVQVKSGVYLSAVEREQLTSMACPPCGSIECWRFSDRVRDPVIEVL